MRADEGAGGVLGALAFGVPVRFDPNLVGVCGRWSAAAYYVEEPIITLASLPVAFGFDGGSVGPVRKPRTRPLVILEPGFFALTGALNLAGYHRAALELPGENLDRGH